jgi:LysM repeat protein
MKEKFNSKGFILVGQKFSFAPCGRFLVILVSPIPFCETFQDMKFKRSLFLALISLLTFAFFARQPLVHAQAMESPLSSGVGAVFQQEATAHPGSGMLTSTPAADGSVTHTVKEGESLWSIATAYGVTIEQIQALNGLTADSDVINIGDNLLIYAAGSFPTSEVLATVEQDSQITLESPAPTQMPSATLSAAVSQPELSAASPLPPAATAEKQAEAAARKLTFGRTIAMVFVPIAAVLLLLFVLNYQDIGPWKLPRK